MSATAPKPSRLELVARGAVLGVFIARAALLYLRAALDARRTRPHAAAAREPRYTKFAADFVETATRYRGGLIKLGQVASLRIDVLPAAVTDELSRLQDRVEPHPFAEIDLQLQAELGPAWRERFAEFEVEPVASASLGQVHRATACDGRQLAVKVLYPGIEDSVSVDLAAARVALWGFNWIVLPDLMQVYRQIRDALLGEMDYEREAAAALRIGANLARDASLAAHVRIPAIDKDLTRRRVLVMEYIEGTRINDLDALEAKGREIDDVVLWATRAFLHMMLRDGDFHCDPHPGNLLIDEAGRVAIVDFGMNMQLAEGTLVAMRDHIVSVVQRDKDRWSESLVELGMVDKADLPIVRELSELAFDPKYFNLTPRQVSEIDMVEYFSELRVHMRQIRGFRIPDGLVMWGRALSLLYGLVSELAPGLRPMDVVGPYVFDFLGGGIPPARPRDGVEARTNEGGEG
ncbi:MAG: AarF/UbiB family protein [Myxococcota bacterium]|nr:AarF/UbiB family protein [Myxococcota bacterium]